MGGGGTQVASSNSFDRSDSNFYSLSIASPVEFCRLLSVYW